MIHTHQCFHNNSFDTAFGLILFRITAAFQKKPAFCQLPDAARILIKVGKRPLVRIHGNMIIVSFNIS